MPLSTLSFPTDDLFHFLSTFGKWKECGDKVALVCAETGRRVKYCELEERVLVAAQHLSALGLQPGDVLSIHLHNCVEYIIAFLACAALGSIASPSNPAYAGSDLGHQLSDSGAVLCVSSKRYTKVLEEACKHGTGESALRKVVYIEDDDCFVHATPGGAVPAGTAYPGGVPSGGLRPDPAGVLALPYSSGTTGKAKGVMLNHQSIVCNILQSTEDPDVRFEISSSDTLVTVLPLFHIYGLTVQMLCTLAKQATLVVIPKFDPANFLKVVQEHRVTVACMVPPMLVILDKEPTRGGYDLSSLRALYCGAAPLDAATQTRIAEVFKAEVRQAYGTTETSPIISVANVSRAKNTYGSVGKLVPNTTCKVVDDEKVEVPSSEGGELCIKGPQVMMGYLNRPDATKLALDEHGYYHTGDAAHLDAAGNVFIGDRKKDLIKVMGFQVAPAELEGLLLEDEHVNDACVVGVADELTGEVPIAFVVLSDPSYDPKLLRKCFQTVASYKKPREFIVIDKVPKSASGKILRRELRDGYKPGKKAQAGPMEAASRANEPGSVVRIDCHSTPHRSQFEKENIVTPEEERQWALRYRSYSLGLDDWYGLVAKCGAAISCTYKLKLYAAELLDGVLHATSIDPYGQHLADKALVQLFHISVAASGTEVAVVPGSPSAVVAEATGGAGPPPSLAAPSVAVLVLGYAGSSLPLLKPIAAAYQRLQPTWTVVMTTGPGVPRANPYTKKACALQHDWTVAELEGYDKIVVHLMSNNGHAQWATLLEAKGAEFASRVAAIVYDCAGDRNLASQESSLLPLPAEVRAKPPSTYSSIVGCCVSTLISWQINGNPPVSPMSALKEKIEAATAGLLERSQTPCEYEGNGYRPPSEYWWGYHLNLGEEKLNIFDFTATHEPPVPTLMLTSDGDDVIPAPAVTEFQGFLTTVQPTRAVSVAKLSGPHCQLHQTDSQAYSKVIAAFLDSAFAVGVA